jgi:vacuolar protein-sorting-associated protein 4
MKFLFISFLSKFIISAIDRDTETSNGSKRVLSQLLDQMTALRSPDGDGVYVIGATNLPWSLDSAIWRRFDANIHLELPNLEDRIELLKHGLSKNPHTITDKEMGLLGKATEGRSPKDIMIAIGDAATFYLQEVYHHSTLFELVGTGRNGKPIYRPTQRKSDTSITLSLLPPNSLEKKTLGYNDILPHIERRESTVRIGDFYKMIDFADTNSTLLYENLKTTKK